MCKLRSMSLDVISDFAWIQWNLRWQAQPNSGLIWQNNWNSEVLVIVPFVRNDLTVLVVMFFFVKISLMTVILRSKICSNFRIFLMFNFWKSFCATVAVWFRTEILCVINMQTFSKTHTRKTKQQTKTWTQFN